ncbi:hypothetical protein WDU94_010995, partial [Cyamophila willieti]
MASRLDDSDYLSPAKRLKLDNESFLNSENVSNSSSEPVIQENNSTLTPEDLPLPPIINFEEVVVSNVVDDLSDLPSCSSPMPSLPPTEEQLADIVEPLGEHNQDDDPTKASVTSLTPPDNNDDDDDDDDDVSSTVSNLSDISGISNISGLDWKSGNFSGSLMWVQDQMAKGINPRDVLSHILGADARIPEQIDDQTLWRLVLNMICEPKRRQRLRHISSFNDVIHLLKTCSKIIVLTGAGVSVSCGIPDFRSRDGIYSRLAVDFPNLPDPQAMFDINYFKQDPRPFFKFAREIYPGQFKPSPCHRFIKMLERHGKLLRNYSQNIDTLEQVAGIENVIECHGSFATASCTRCGYRVSADAIKEDVFAQRIPLCPSPACGSVTLSSPSLLTESSPPTTPNTPITPGPGVMKPDIVFFGEGLPDSFHSAMAQDKSKCDLLIVIGSSLKVRPVALIPNSLPPSVPQILINRERLSHLNFDVELLGDGDVIIDTLCRALGGDWTDVCCRDTPLAESRSLLTPPTHYHQPALCSASASPSASNSSPVPLFRNVLNPGDCSEGEMSIDSTRDSGLGGSLMGGAGGGERAGRHPSVDSRMEEDEGEDDLSSSGVKPASDCEHSRRTTVSTPLLSPEVDSTPTTTTTTSNSVATTHHHSLPSHSPPRLVDRHTSARPAVSCHSGPSPLD